MKQEMYLDKLHTEMLSIMDIVDGLCRKYHIHYYLAGGTLLGAVRHKGFIPWDDDMDIVIPREEYGLFLDIAKRELPNGYILNWITEDKNYYLPYAKISKDGTLFGENLGNGHMSDFGIFIDVFPLDGFMKVSKRITYRKKIIDKIGAMMFHRRNPCSMHGIKKVLISMFPNTILFQISEFLMKMTTNSSNQYLICFASRYSANREMFEKAYYGEGKSVLFEGREYIGPDQPTEILKKQYGDYMTIPKESERRIHYPLKVVFSDGEECAFEYEHN